nr:MAG TPA: hypothetical protein [Caudoviricetes sp.]
MIESLSRILLKSVWLIMKTAWVAHLHIISSPFAVYIFILYHIFD